MPTVPSTLFAQAVLDDRLRRQRHAQELRLVRLSLLGPSRRNLAEQRRPS